MPHSVAPINAAVNNKATVREEHKEEFYHNKKVVSGVNKEINLF
jgi:hypothetical protein